MKNSGTKLRYIEDIELSLEKEKIILNNHTFKCILFV